CICHFILPVDAVGAATRRAGGRYGETAFAMMRAELQRHGVLLDDCVAKIFGGGRMFGAGFLMNDIGERNIRTARQMVQQAGLTITAEHVGGDGYRRIYFDVATGDVWLKFDWIDSDQKDMVL
ncbi:MAG: chemotaxis protein CheD, partial [Burkholderiaceae bacterium]